MEMTKQELHDKLEKLKKDLPEWLRSEKGSKEEIINKVKELKVEEEEKKNKRGCESERLFIKYALRPFFDNNLSHYNLKDYCFEVQSTGKTQIKNSFFNRHASLLNI